MTCPICQDAPATVRMTTGPDLRPVCPTCLKLLIIGQTLHQITELSRPKSPPKSPAPNT